VLLTLTLAPTLTPTLTLALALALALTLTLAPTLTLALALARCDEKLFVPKFVVRDHRGANKYLIRPDTCCFDCCLVIRCNLGGDRRALTLTLTLP